MMKMKMKRPRLRAPFWYYGVKHNAAQLVWSRFGDVTNYNEPFFGAGGVLLNRPTRPQIEIVNDFNCFLANFWRAVAYDPDGLAEMVNWPVNEVDLMARQAYMLFSHESARFRKRMFGDSDYYDLRLAAWWVWGQSQWVAGSFCSTEVVERARRKFRRPILQKSTTGYPTLYQARPAVTTHGQGGLHGAKILGHQLGKDSLDKLIDRLSGSIALRHGARDARLIATKRWFGRLSDRLRHVAVMSGDWKRCVGSKELLWAHSPVGVFLDPPYMTKVDGGDNRAEGLYAEDSGVVALEVREWCLEHGDNQLMRIALCGLEGEHNVLEEHGWTKSLWASWHPSASLRKDRHTLKDREERRAGGKGIMAPERIWFSPHCLEPEVDSLF